MDRRGATRIYRLEAVNPSPELGHEAYGPYFPARVRILRGADEDSRSRERESVLENGFQFQN